VNRIEVSRPIDRSQEAVFEAVEAFHRYPAYSKYLEAVSQVGTREDLPEYALEFAWWRLSYETRTRVLASEPPQQLDWTVVGVDASGTWTVEPLGDDRARLGLAAQYDFDSVGSVSLPIGVSRDWLEGKVADLIEGEADRVLSRIAADLETQRSRSMT
jgi:ribosome-associated toxin RatA of RatAB toxin-antitoxin module